MPHEKDRRTGRTYVEPGELTARERDRERRRRRQADGATGDQQEPEGDPASRDGAPRTSPTHPKG